MTSSRPDAPQVAQHEAAITAPYASDLGFPDDVSGSKAFIDPLDAIISRIQDDSIPTAWEIIHQLHSFPSSEAVAFRGSQKSRPRSPSLRARAPLPFQQLEARLVVRYDYETPGAWIARKRVAFYDVLAIGYRKSALHLDGNVQVGSELRCASQSKWLSEVMTSWQLQHSRAERTDNKQPGRAFKHYTVRSIHGSVDVIAMDCRPMQR